MGAAVRPLAEVVDEWSTYTPDGRRLLIRREGQTWVVKCGEAAATSSGLLDVALIEALREDADVATHGMRVDYAAWVRNLADSLGGYDVGGAAT
jgi:hypothetical protein